MAITAVTLLSSWAASGASAIGPLAPAHFRAASADGTKVFFETTERLVAADTDGVVIFTSAPVTTRP